MSRLAEIRGRSADDAVRDAYYDRAYLLDLVARLRPYVIHAYQCYDDKCKGCGVRMESWDADATALLEETKCETPS